MKSRAGRRPGAIYAIADLERLGAARLPSAVAEMAEAGIETIQIRAKRAADRELAQVVGESRRALAGWKGELWIDDRVDFASVFALDGVHLGRHDLPAGAARPLLAESCAIGVSTHSEAELAAAELDAAADWVAIGPIFPTSSKEAPDPVIGLERLRACRALTGKPLVAIGGIDEERLAPVFAAGADAAAVLSAICGVSVGEIGATCRRLVRRAEEAQCASS